VHSRSRNASRLRIVLHTGWRRQIRRMLSVVGLRTVRLVRIRVGDLPLGNLKAGEWRELTPKEIADLAKPVENQRKPGRRAASRLAATAKVAPNPRPVADATPNVPTTGAVPKPELLRGSVLPRSREAVGAAPRRLDATGSQGVGAPRRGATARGPSAPRPSRGLRPARPTSFASSARPRPSGGAARTSSPRAPQASQGRLARSTRPSSMSASSSRGTSAMPPRRPAPQGRPVARGPRPPIANRAPTRRLPSLTRPVVRKGAPTGPRRPVARGPQRFGRRPPPKYGSSRGPVRARIAPR
jgi:hypothetical protein